MGKSQRPGPSRTPRHTPPGPVDPAANDRALTGGGAGEDARYSPVQIPGDGSAGVLEDDPDDREPFEEPDEDGEADPELGDPRGAPEDFSHGAKHFPVGPYGAGSDNTDGKIDPITRRLRALGAQLAIKVQRLEPRDLPPTEMGWSPWTTFPAMNPLQDDIEEFIHKRHGGGTFEVQVRSAMDRSRFLPDPIRINLSGQWKPHTPDGAEFYRMRYNAEYPIDGDGASPSGSAPSPASDGSSIGAATSILTESMRMAQRQMEHKGNLESVKATAESNALVGIVSALGGQRQQLDVVAIGGLLLTYMTNQSNQRIEAEKLQFQREQAAREASTKDREFMIALLTKKDEGAGGAAALAAIDIVKEAAKGESGLKLEFMRGMMKQALGAAGLDTDDGEKETISSMLVDLLKDGVKNLPQILTALKQGRPPESQALPPGYVRLPDGRIATLEQAQALQNAARQQQLAAGQQRRGLPPPPPPPAPPPPAPVRTQPGNEIAQPMPGTVPPPELAPPPLPPAPATPPEPVGGDIPLPADDHVPLGSIVPVTDVPFGPPAEGSPVLAGPGAQPEPTPPAPIDEAYIYLGELLAVLARYAAKPQDLRIEPSTFWETELDNGEILDDAWKKSPASFRKATENADPEDPLAFTEWVKHLAIPQLTALATTIDEALLQDATAGEWVRSVLDEGPWTEPEEDDDEAP